MGEGLGLLSPEGERGAASATGGEAGATEPSPVASGVVGAGTAGGAEGRESVEALGDGSFPCATSGVQGVVPGGEVGWGPAGLADGVGGDWVASGGAGGEPQAIPVPGSMSTWSEDMLASNERGRGERKGRELGCCRPKDFF